MTEDGRRERGRVSGIVANPLAVVAAAVFLLAAGMLASYFLGQASVRGVVAAAALLVLTVLGSAMVGFSATRHLLLDAISRDLVVLRDKFHSLVDRVLEAISKLDTRMGVVLTAASGNAQHQSVLTDTEFAAIESGPSVKRVCIAIREMGNEFQEALQDRDAYVDYRSVVTENIDRGVTYTWITVASNVNRSRAKRVSRMLGEKRASVEVVMVTHQRWQELPFPVEVVFITLENEQMEGFMLIPNEADKADRSWVKLSDRYRDEWWGAAETVLENAKTLEPNSD